MPIPRSGIGDISEFLNPAKAGLNENCEKRDQRNLWLQISTFQIMETLFGEAQKTLTPMSAFQVLNRIW